MLVRKMEQNGGRKSRWTVPLTKQKNHTTFSQGKSTIPLQATGFGLTCCSMGVCGLIL